MDNDIVLEIYAEGSREYKILSLAAAMMNFLSDDGTSYYVDNMSFGLGLGVGVEWTTILCSRPGIANDDQALYPLQQSKLLEADSITEIETIVRDILNS